MLESKQNNNIGQTLNNIQSMDVYFLKYALKIENPSANQFKNL